MEIRTGHRSEDSDEPSQDFVTVELTKGPSGVFRSSLPREQLRGQTYRGIVERALLTRGSGDPFAADTSAILGDPSYSLERVESGRQSHRVGRNSTVEDEVVDQETLRLAFVRDHTGGL